MSNIVTSKVRRAANMQDCAELNNLHINNLFVGPSKMTFGLERGGKLCTHKVITHNAIWAKSEDLIFFVSLATRTGNV